MEETSEPVQDMTESEEQPYVFPDRPAAKSSTTVLAPPGKIMNPVCQVCGCKRGGKQKMCRGCTCHG